MPLDENVYPPIALAEMRAWAGLQPLTARTRVLDLCLALEDCRAELAGAKESARSALADLVEALALLKKLDENAQVMADLLRELQAALAVFRK